MKAMIVYGGWDGHEPRQVSEILERELKAKGFDVERSDKIESLLDVPKVMALDVIIPIWTMGQLPGEVSKVVHEAVRSGVALAGVHGGMGDAFRGDVGYQWMVGGQFVGHPHVGDYEVRLTANQHEITDGMPLTFPYKSEQYYMIVDPGNHVLAETVYTYEGKRIIMPVVWTKTWGKGRVFYSSLGHVASEFTTFPAVLAMTVRGIVWAAQGKSCGCCCE